MRSKSLLFMRPDDEGATLRWGGGRYPIVCGVLLILTTAIVLQQPWVGDFWEHAAVNRELAQHPFSPSHPMLDVDAPHAFFSPYALLWGLIGRISGLGPVAVLGLAAIVNTVFLLVALRRFVGAYSPETTDAASAYALIFVVLLWGPDPWIFSGCFQLGGFANVAPYPSCFATAVTLLVLASARDRLRETTWPWLAALCVAAWVVLLSHPMTFGFLAIGLGATALSTRNWNAVLQTGGVLAVAAIAAAAWPYYPFWQLVTGQGESFRLFNLAMFRQVIPRILPVVVVGLPFLIRRVHRDLLDPLAVTVFGLTAVYLVGFAMQHGVLGRALLDVVILLQVVGAIGVAGLEERLASRTALRRAVFVSVVLVASSAVAYPWTVGASLKTAWHGTGARLERFIFLHDHLGQGDVVLAKARRGWYFPVTGAKIVVPRTPLAFVPDLAQRKRKVDEFFRSGATPEERLEIIRRWGVTHVMLETDRAASRGKVIDDLGDRLELVEKRGPVMLFRVVDPASTG